MVLKRPFGDDMSYDVSSKHPRQLENTDQLTSVSDIPPRGDTPLRPQVLGEEKLAPEINGEPLTTSGKDIEMNGFGNISTLPWDDRSETPQFHFPLFPDYYIPVRPLRPLVHSEDTYSSLLEHPPRKLVPIGPNHQAEVPELTPQHSENDLSHISTYEPKAWDPVDRVGAGRTECSCRDRGSMRCVRQHVAEAREKLERSIGYERFVELGFSHMGEQVAEKWSDEEEHFFHEIVYSNPASLNKNFWAELFLAFPSRTKSDIVSYYFNVFMLRKRAHQNRVDSMSIDSDNDDYEEDEDSVIESPVHQHGLDLDSIREGEEEYDEDDDDDDETCDDYPSGKVPWDERDRDERDDSCTSSDTGPAVNASESKADDGKHFEGGFSGGMSHQYISEPCDAKVWDIGYLEYPKTDFDFLPTCSMIKELFGEGDCNYKPNLKTVDDGVPKCDI